MERRTLLIITSTLFVLCTMAMFAIDTYIQNETTPNGIVSFEFIGNIPNSNAAMATWGNIGQSAVALSLGIDYLYIVLYSATVSLFLLSLSAKVLPASKALSNHLLYLAYLFPLAGASDAIENFSLIQILLGSQNPLWPKIAYICAIIKFFGAGICVVSIIIGQVYVSTKKATQPGRAHRLWRRR